MLCPESQSVTPGLASLEDVLKYRGKMKAYSRRSTILERYMLLLVSVCASQFANLCRLGLCNVQSAHLISLVGEISWGLGNRDNLKICHTLENPGTCHSYFFSRWREVHVLPRLDNIYSLCCELFDKYSSLSLVRTGAMRNRSLISCLLVAIY